jgi:2-octaprenylphenol hydroxylase
MNARYEIVVVGGGPVGAAAALALAQRDFAVALVERGAQPPACAAHDYDARVYALAPRSAQFLEALGAWDALRRARVSPYVAMHVWETDPARGLHFQADDAGRGELGWIVEHGLIVSALWAQLRGVERITGAAVESLEFGAPGARLRLAGDATLAARLIVAADGADSQLRRLAGIPTRVRDYGEHALVCHVRTAQPHRASAYQRFLPSGPLAFLPLADGRSSIVWSAQDALARELLALDDAAFRVRLGEAAQHVLGAIEEATPRRAFPLRAQQASEYARPGLVLIGDAAHTVHPLAGQGLNLGLADAERLAATLAAARQTAGDWSGARVLARYARARKAANLEMWALTEALDRAFRLRLPGVRAALGLGLQAVDRLSPIRAWLARQATGA